MKKSKIVLCFLGALICSFSLKLNVYADNIDDYLVSSYYSNDDLERILIKGITKVERRHITELCDELGFDANEWIDEHYYGILLGGYTEKLERIYLDSKGLITTASYDNNRGVIKESYRFEGLTMDDIVKTIEYYAPEDKPVITNNHENDISILFESRENLLRPKYVINQTEYDENGTVYIFDEDYLEQAIDKTAECNLLNFDVTTYRKQIELDVKSTVSYLDGKEIYSHDYDTGKYYSDGNEIDLNTVSKIINEYTVAIKESCKNCSCCDRKKMDYRKLKNQVDEIIDKSQDEKVQTEDRITSERAQEIRIELSNCCDEFTPNRKLIFDTKSESTSDYLNYKADFQELDDSFVTRAKTEMLRLVNEFRISEGLDPLDDSSLVLDDISDTRAKEIGYLMAADHCRPNGEPLHKHFNVGENACNTSAITDNPEALAKFMFDMWCSSAGHRKNMLNKNYEIMSFGLSLVKIGDSYVYYGVQNFSCSNAQLFDYDNKDLDTSVIKPNSTLIYSNGDLRVLPYEGYEKIEGVQRLVGDVPAIRGKIPVYTETDMNDVGQETCKVTIRDENLDIICGGYCANNGYYNYKYSYFEYLDLCDNGDVIFNLKGSDSDLNNNLNEVGDGYMETIDGNTHVKYYKDLDDW